MATFSGLHIECAPPMLSFGPITVPKILLWSETFTTATTSTNDGDKTEGGESLVTISATGSDWWVSFGISPADPATATNARMLVKDGDIRSVALPDGFKVRGAPVA